MSRKSTDESALNESLHRAIGKHARGRAAAPPASTFHHLIFSTMDERQRPVLLLPDAANAAEIQLLTPRCCVLSSCCQRRWGDVLTQTGNSLNGKKGWPPFRLFQRRDSGGWSEETKRSLRSCRRREPGPAEVPGSVGAGSFLFFFPLPRSPVTACLDRWLSWVRRCSAPTFDLDQIIWPPSWQLPAPLWKVGGEKCAKVPECGRIIGPDASPGHSSWWRWSKPRSECRAEPTFFCWSTFARKIRILQPRGDYRL